MFLFCSNFGSDLVDLCNSSKDNLVKSLLVEDPVDELADIGTGTLRRGATRVLTISSQFKVTFLTSHKVDHIQKQLDDLMNILTSCNPFYIRCIKPNMFQKPSTFDDSMVQEQLKYLGMMETIKANTKFLNISHILDP
jgi:myosin heavy subunit